MSNTKHGAQIVFEQRREREWVGSLVSDLARDRQSGNQLARDPLTHFKYYQCVITEDHWTTPEDKAVVSYQLMTQGRDAGGRRYRGFGTLDEAQDAAVKWARTRFYVEDAQGEE